MFKHLIHTGALCVVITSIILLLSYNLTDYLTIFHLALQRPCQHAAAISSVRKMSNKDGVELTGKASEWLQNQFTSLYQSVPPPPEEEYNMTSLVYSAFGKDAEIIVNHERTTLRKFQEDLEAANFGVAGSTVEWRDLMEVPAQEGEESSGVS